MPCRRLSAPAADELEVCNTRCGAARDRSFDARGYVIMARVVFWLPFTANLLQTLKATERELGMTGPSNRTVRPWMMERYRRHSWRSKSRPHSSVPGNITGLLCFKQGLAPRTESTPWVKCSANRLSASALGREPNLAKTTPRWHDDCNGDGVSLRKRKYYRANFPKAI